MSKTEDDLCGTASLGLCPLVAVIREQRPSLGAFLTLTWLKNKK